MRGAACFPLTFTAALLAACAAESPRPSGQETGSVREQTRDLTLQVPAGPAIEIASAVELSRATPEPRPAPRPKKAPKPAPVPAPDPVPEAAPLAEAAVPIPSVALAEVVAEPAPVEDVTAGAGRELAPGKTVTAIPASSGPSLAPEEPEWVPTERGRGIMIGGGGGHGDRCRPRGGVRGIGIAGRIPMGIPGRRLR